MLWIQLYTKDGWQTDPWKSDNYQQIQDIGKLIIQKGFIERRKMENKEQLLS
jgi:hypothetical protein